MIRVYLSHAIRGKAAQSCTIGEQNTNCSYAKIMAGKIRAGLKHPVDLYVPAEHEEFIQIAFQNKYMTERQILNTDCEIVEKCQCIVILVPEGDELQGGRLVEHDFAIDNMINVCVFSRAKEAIDFIEEIAAYEDNGNTPLNFNDKE